MSASDAGSRPMSDMNMVIALDSSGSISTAERRLQFEGVAYALKHENFLAAVRGGVHANISISIVSWNAEGRHPGASLLVPWMTLSNKKDAELASSVLLQNLEEQPSNPPLAQTDISLALRSAIELLSAAPAFGSIQVVNVIGDGLDNAGESPSVYRDIAVEQGTTINALIVAEDKKKVLENYYRENVIGGFRSFVQVTTDFNSFADAMLHKMLTEMAALMPPTTARVVY
ncbi:MAG: DUF1194 domain-containing protein [Pseudomonadota bacterium]